MTSSPPADNQAPGISIEQRLHNAADCNQKGRAEEAEEQYRAILLIQADHPEANFALGLLALRKNLPSASLPFFETALDKRPDHGPYWITYIDALDKAGQSDLAKETLNIAKQAGLEGKEVDALWVRLNTAHPPEAAETGISQIPQSPQTQQAQADSSANTLNPQQADIDNLLSLYNQNKFTDCETLARSILADFPDNGFTWKVLGAVLKQLERPDEALEPMRKAVALRPQDPEALSNLGCVLQIKGLFSESETVLRLALAIKGDFAAAHNNLGLVFKSQNKLEESESCFRLALKLDPNYADAYNNLGNVFRLQGRYVEAEMSLRKALDLKPECTTAFVDLGAVLQCQGRIEESEDCYNKALKIDPGYLLAYEGLLFISNYHPDKSGEEIFQLFMEYKNKLLAPEVSCVLPHRNTTISSRRIKVGYVSPSFFKHPVSYILEPLLEHHDKTRFELFAYPEIWVEDQLTARYKQFFEHWIPTNNFSDSEFVEQIRNDGIDILVDLAGHTIHNRLNVFARKPAPVSLHWLDFGYTTGLSAIDYYLGDIHSTPIGSENLFSEKLWRLPVPSFVYRPQQGMGEVSPLPAIQNGYITFGTLTRAIRMNYRTIRTWSAILKRIPGSRLVINNSNFNDQATQKRLTDKFAALGIDTGRLEIGYNSPPWDILRSIDICLDCFPHNSGTTLVESLYMGLPFITLAGRPSVGRLGCSILEGIGHPELITQTEEEYIELGVKLASDLEKLSTLRAKLRQEMKRSPLMDEKGFAQKVEAAYQEMFSLWYNATTRTVTIDQLQEKESSGNREVSTIMHFVEKNHFVHEQSRKQGKGQSKTKETRKTRPNRPSNTDIQRLTELFNQGKRDEAFQLSRSMTSRFPHHGFGWKILGPLLFQQGMIDDAIQAMKQAIICQPDDPEMYYNLGIAQEQSGLLEEAEKTYRRVLQFNKNHVKALFNLGNILDKNEHPAEAEKLYMRALKLKPDYFEVLCNLGSILRKQGRFDESIDIYQSALKIRPDSAEALSNLSLAYKFTGNLEEAEILCKKALQLQPELPEANNNLGIIYQERGRFAEAELWYKKAIEFKPGYYLAVYNLGNLFLRQFRFTETVEIYLQALEFQPEDPNFHSYILYLLNYSPDITAEKIYEFYQKFNVKFSQAFQTEWRPFTNSRDIHRRLRVGYVSPSFSKHSSRHFLEPLFAHHDKHFVEVFAYADLRKEDSFTKRYRSYADHWIDTINLSDADLSKRIRTDAIDILVDLSGHTQNNRLGTFSRKPAPVSLHWLDFGYTTGLTAIDYYLADHVTVPVGSEGLFSETPWRIAPPASVYRPSAGMGEASPLPALNRGYVTFGTLTRAIRLNDRTITVWAEVLKRVPGSRLVIDSRDFEDQLMKTNLENKFFACGIGMERLDIGYHSPPWDVIRGVDIGLDCFPNNSGTTLIETIYLGVPYITLMGRPSVGRIGSAVLTGLGHPEWIAKTEDDYIDLAVHLASDLPRLEHLRKTLRHEMEKSPLMDEPAFARQVESAYKEMFRIWVEKETETRLPPYNEKNDSSQVNALAPGQANGCPESVHPEDTEEIYRLILKEKPDNPEANYNLGLMELDRRQSARAIPYFEAAIDARPEHGPYWLAYIEALDKAGQRESAFQIMEMAIKAGLDGKDAEALKCRLTGKPSETLSLLSIPANESDALPSPQPQERGQSTPPSEPEDINTLISLFNQKRYADGEILACSLVKRFPENGFLWKALGFILKSQGRLEEAVLALQKSILLSPEDQDISDNLGDILHTLGRFSEAIAVFQRSLEQAPQRAETHYYLANALFAESNLQDAETSYKKALELKPDFAEALGNLGNTLLRQGRIEESEACYRHALAINHDLAEVCYNFGNLCKEQHRLAEALDQYRKTINLNNSYVKAHCNLGITLQMQRRLDEAEACYRKALEIQPDFVEAHINLGACLKDQGRYLEAENSYRMALTWEPDSALTYNNLGSVLKEHGLLSDAEQCLRRALAIKPDYVEAFSNLLFLLNYHPDMNAQEIYAEYRNFNALFGLPLQSEWQNFSNNRRKDRRLKVGYVSPQFRQHSVRHFLEPLLACHHKDQVEVFAYADVSIEDAFTRRYRSYTEHWCTTASFSDSELARKIREDGIDILVDLSGHTANNRLGVFARKPAPVSLHWLDFGYTTGLTAIDYYLTDEASVPTGSENLFSEKPWRLGTPAFVYRPDSNMGSESPLPASDHGYITFGTLSRAVRINHRVIRVWSEILKRLEGSRLIIDSSNFRDPAMQEELADKFTAKGIARDRLVIGFHSPPWDVLRSLDIGLDCFPHNSGTTLIETLYMGVPYITLASRPSVGTTGSSLLKAIGHTEWIAQDEENYIELAVALAADPEKLKILRAGLRQEIEGSPLRDEQKFAHLIETAYREMFEQWVDSRQPKNQQHTGNNKTRNQSQGTTNAPNPPSEETNRLISLYQQGNIAEAETLARSQIQSFPKNTQAWKIIGAIFRQQGQLEEALSAMEMIVKLCPDDHISLRNLAILLSDLGRFAEAEAICRTALSLRHDYAEAFDTLGVIFRAENKFPESESSFRKSLQLQPDSINAIINLSLVLNDQEKFPEAELSCRRALELKPDSAEAYCCLGTILKNLERLREAEEACRQALLLQPIYAAAANTLGSIFSQQENYSGAESEFRRALEADPLFVGALHNLGISLYNQFRYVEAQTCFLRVLELEPSHVDACYDLGNSMLRLGKNEEAEACYRAVLKNKHDHSKAIVNLGRCVHEQGRLAEAEKIYRNALRSDPHSVIALNNLANTLQEQGKFNEAEKIFRSLMQSKPDFAMGLSNLLFLLNYHPDKNAEEIFQEYNGFEERFGRPLQNEWKAHLNNNDKDRRLKVGYVSPKFCKHPVCNFLEPLLAHHDKKIVELYAYAELPNGEDGITERYKSYMDHWIPTHCMTDAEMAERIRSDCIDILVDLAGHTENNRLLVFARKPAPISLHWLDFGYTTGLKAIDYYLADNATVPQGSEELFSEKPWRIATPCCVYRPTSGMGEVNALPAISRGHITFGCLSRAVRINHRVINAWVNILKQVSGSHLVINSGSFRDPEMKQLLADKFEAHGIKRNRVEIGYYSPPWDVLRGIDIALDCFPNNSGTTLIESIYMGIPFITLTDRPSVGRTGSAILEGIGHTEWIASSEDEYVKLAMKLASNQAELASIRTRLRQELQGSPFMDEPAFTRKVEAAYREMFIQWCEEQQ